MKCNLKNLTLMSIALILICSCANTSTPPMGGPKDTLSPILVKVYPDSNSLNIKTVGTKIELQFNEYVTLKDAQKHIFLSPAQKKKPLTKIRGKSVIVEFPLPLDSSKTYNLNFGTAIVDNNEGNLFPPYSLAFSTGKKIDSMITTGSIVDYKTLLPLEEIIVGFYENDADSAVFKEFPAMYAKSDKWGYYVVPNLKPIPYRVFAFQDVNNNTKYDPENEKVAFLDGFFTPSLVMKKGMKELQYVKLKDTSACMARPKQIDLHMFKEPSSKQYVKNTGRTGLKASYITFASPNARIDSMGFEGVDTSKIIKQFNITKDSLVLWINDVNYKAPDTMYLNIKYYKTDTLNNLTLSREKIRLVAPKVKKASKENTRNNFGLKEEKVREDLLQFKINAEPDMVEQNGIILQFSAPLVSNKVDSIKITNISPKGQVGKESFTVKKDSTNNCIYYLKTNNKLKQGFEYKLLIPKNIFKDIYGFTNDSLSKSVILPNSEKLGKITLNVTDVKGDYIFELTNLTRERVFRTFKINKDSKLEFPYVKPDKYSIRITQDLNGNGILDVGSVLEKKQPDKVRLYSLPSGSTIIEILEAMEIEQEVNLMNIFK